MGGIVLSFKIVTVALLVENPWTVIEGPNLSFGVSDIDVDPKGL